MCFAHAGVCFRCKFIAAEWKMTSLVTFINSGGHGYADEEPACHVYLLNCVSGDHLE
jgi:hypothetical protein